MELVNNLFFNKLILDFDLSVKSAQKLSDSSDLTNGMLSDCCSLQHLQNIFNRKKLKKLDVCSNIAWVNLLLRMTNNFFKKNYDKNH